MRKTRPSGGDIDPVLAKIYRPERQSMASGEATALEYVLFKKVRIKSPRGLWVAERSNQGHAQSTSDLAIEVRNENGGESLTADMVISHRRNIYQIKGRLRQDWLGGTTVYQVTEINDFRVSKSSPPGTVS